MKCQYFIEHVLRDRIRAPRYEPVGVWVQGSSPGLDVVMRFLPGNEDAEDEAAWVLNRLVEVGATNLSTGFLAYWQAALPTYQGMRGSIVETDQYPSAEKCAEVILASLLIEKPRP